MLSLLSSSDNYLRLTQTAHACIVLNTSCKKSEHEFAECVIVMLSLGYHLCMSLFGAFLFSVKRFCRFQGCNQRPDRRRHVPFWGILVSEINDLLFSGGAIGANGGRGMSQNEQTIFLENKNVHFRDIKRPKTAQNGPKRPKKAQICRIICVHVPF